MPSPTDTIWTILPLKELISLLTIAGLLIKVSRAFERLTATVDFLKLEVVEVKKDINELWKYLRKEN